MSTSRAAALAALVLAVLVAAGAWRLSTEAIPPLAVHRLLAAGVRVPGRAPALQWPREGEAAVAVVGLGSLGGSGGDARVPIASVAKMMTAYLVLREHPLAPGQEGFSMTVTPAAVAEQAARAAAGESTVILHAGQRITERRALQALLLPSANNVAAMLAAHSAGGAAGFVTRMNATARALGMSSTTYTDPSGYEDSTVSTAADQLRLARAAMAVPALAATVGERSARLPSVGSVANYDALLGEDGYVGVKTGSDRAAGGCFAFAKLITVGGRRLMVVGVVLGQREGSLIDSALASARALGDSAAASLGLRTVLPAGTRVLTASAAGGGRTIAVTAAPVREVAWAGQVLPVGVSLRAPSRTVRAGQSLATVTVPVAVHGGPGRTAAVARGSLPGPSLGWRLGHIL